MQIGNSLELNSFGFEECLSSKSFGPAVRDYYLIHYIIRGTGTFQIGDDIYHLSPGQMFAICPGDVTFYKADKKDPWSYAWIGFSGEDSKSLVSYLGISKQDPIKDIPTPTDIEKILLELASISTLGISEGFKAKSLMYAFFSELFKIWTKPQKASNTRIQNSYVSAVENHIRNNYQHPISIAGIADMLGLDRCYLSTLFKKTNKKSIQEYLIEYRLRRAIKLLRETDLSILEITCSIGYSDQFVFSKAFKKKFGIAPNKIREQIVEKC